MKKHFDHYRRLAKGSSGCSSLWLGPRDLLYVRGGGFVLPFTEEYLRFELARIQAVSYYPTRTGLVLTLCFGAVALLFGGIGAGALVNAWRMGFSGDAVVVTMIFGGPCLLLGLLALGLLIYNLARGPTCVCKIQTAARQESLRPVRRVKTARRVLAELQPALAAARQPPAYTSSTATP